jgi:hypothetical protein
MTWSNPGASVEISGKASICCDATICPKIAKPIIYSTLFPRRVLLLLCFAVCAAIADDTSNNTHSEMEGDASCVLAK